MRQLHQLIFLLGICIACSTATAQNSQLTGSTFFGGSGEDWIVDIAIASNGDIMVLGNTKSSDLPLAGTPFSSSFQGGLSDIFVARFDSTMQNLLALTYFGGTGADQGYNLLLTPADDAVIFGSTTSSNLPVTTGAYKDTLTGAQDLFLAVLSGDFQTLMACSYIGAITGDDALGQPAAVLDTAGNIVVAANVESAGFPVTTGGYDTGYNGASDIVIASMDINLQGILASTFYGGGGMDAVSSLLATGNGRIYLVGRTSSLDLPVTAGTISTSLSDTGNFDGFISCLSGDLQTLIYGTYYGGSAFDDITELIDRPGGDLVAAGYTYSNDIPLNNFQAYQYGNRGNADIFVIQVDSALTSVEQATYYGGAGEDRPSAIALNQAGAVYIGGRTYSGDLPVTEVNFEPYTFRPYIGGNNDAFVAKFGPKLVGLAESSFAGGIYSEKINGMVVGASDRVIFGGWTNSADYPVTSGTYDPNLSGLMDGILSSVSIPITSIPENEKTITYCIAEDHLLLTGISQGPVELGIIDMQGRLVFATSLHTGPNSSVDYLLPALPSGMYVCTIRTSSGNKSIKYVRQN